MKRLEILDYSRFFAAIFVLLFHYTFNGITNGKIQSISHIPWLIDFTKYGYLGVELFFMISGFVIYISSKEKSPISFSINRATRLYPTYWFAVLLTSFFAFFLGGELMSVTVTQILSNLTMLQSFLEIEHIDGVYWTLIFEIKFYFAFFILLLLGLQKFLKYIFICWPLLFCTALFFGKESIIYLGEYYYFFCAGALFGIIKENNKEWSAILSLIITYFFCIYFSISKSMELSQIKETFYSQLITGTIISSFFILFIIQNLNKVQNLKLPYSKTAGGLTYSLYLIHAHIGYMLINYFANDTNLVLAYILIFLTIIAISFFIHKVIEIKLHNYWKSFFSYLIGSFSRLKKYYSNPAKERY
ncbi:acyltransferase family protein [Mangrovivirga cuniculi]|uniref:Acyltransferase n=1 Tax=Mangrovivirga cuniculi TaxID=2715131 RepID=A0A4D7JNY0_9BACT|nr:acyltransferase [Mangrovivirga cuniculi]QCK16493.1 acyltransferase [Mangrovivirga cuniculi]